MKIIVDEKECIKSKLTLPEALVCLTVLTKDNTLYSSLLHNLVTREILVYDNNAKDYFVAPYWKDVIDNILYESSGGIDSEERLLNLAKQMRDCYPAGKVPGTPYYYKCNNREIMLALRRFFAKYGNYPDDKIIEATKAFVASYQGNYRFMPLIKYFIIKNKPKMGEDGKNHIEEVSELASYLENKGTETREYSDEWMTNIRN